MNWVVGVARRTAELLNRLHANCHDLKISTDVRFFAFYVRYWGQSGHKIQSG